MRGLDPVEEGVLAEILDRHATSAVPVGTCDACNPEWCLDPTTVIEGIDDVCERLVVRGLLRERLCEYEPENPHVGLTALGLEVLQLVRLAREPLSA